MRPPQNQVTRVAPLNLEMCKWLEIKGGISRFMGSPNVKNLITHWDHEPLERDRSLGRSTVEGPNGLRLPAGTPGATGLERDRPSVAAASKVPVARGCLPGRRVLRECALWLFSLGVALLTRDSVVCGAERPSLLGRPNIVFIMADDHAANAIGCYGSRVNETPHLDRLAKDGMRFGHCYAVNSICTPSRAAILTGQYSHINGVPAFNALDANRPHVAHLLQAGGYYTGMIGKWHLGSNPAGFDVWNILPGQGRYNDPILYDRTGARIYRGYVTDVITGLAIDFIKNRPQDRPFFLMCHHKAPHREWTPDPKHQAMFAQRHIPEPPTLRDDYSTRTDAIKEQQQGVFKDLTRRDLKLKPPAGLSPAEANRWLGVKPMEVEIEVEGSKKILTGENLNQWKYQRYLQDYLACVQSIDDNVGRLLDWLDSQGLSQNTVVIYTSDQGFFLGEHGLYDKRFMYEESIRMPFLVRWPGIIKPGSTASALAINCDFAPTFLDIAGLTPPPEMQGRSLVGLFKGDRPKDWRTSFYYRYYHDPGHHNTRAHYGIRTETHKLIHFWKADQWECYDLVQDPLELKNLCIQPAARQIVDNLKSELWRLKKQCHDDDRFAQQLPKEGVDGPPPPWAPGAEPKP